jgi:hypothetical protein
MSVILNNGTQNITLTCEQWSLLEYVAPSGWVLTENACGAYLDNLRSPFASFGLTLESTRLPGAWYVWEGTVTAGVLTIPTAELTLPSAPNNTHVIIRTAYYCASEPGKTRDYTIDNILNKITFRSNLHTAINGMTARVFAFK